MAFTIESPCVLNFVHVLNSCLCKIMNHFPMNVCSEHKRIDLKFIRLSVAFKSDTNPKAFASVHSTHFLPSTLGLLLQVYKELLK